MPEKNCPKCGELVEAEDLDECADFYYCDCGWELCDTDGWADRMAAHADNLRKQAEGERYMKRVAWAVVKESGKYEFNKWHDSMETAIQEAERLVKLEDKTFLVLKVVAYLERVDRPVKIEILDAR